MKCDTGRLRAYLDGALLPGEQAEVAAHLDTCRPCLRRLADLRAAQQAVAARLDALAPAAGDAPAPGRALARFRAAQRRPRPTRWTILNGGWMMNLQSALGNRWRPALTGVTAVMILALLFSFAPVRDAAADFLGLFRVRKFAVIPLDPQQTDQLAALLQQADSGAFGQPQIRRPAGTEWTVADASQASAQAGYTVRTPSRLPAGTSLEKLTVQQGPAVHYEIDRAVLEMALRAAGARTESLPQTDRLTFDLDIGNTVMQQYRVGPGRLELAQAPSPAVDLPAGIDPTALAETAFLFLGMSADDARRLATSIDWTSTLVIPLPTEAAKAREVSVDSVIGLLLQDASGYKNNALLWERQGIIYLLNGRNVDEKLLLDVADSLR